MPDPIDPSKPPPVRPPAGGLTDEFLNPKSMLTPGIAGSIVMLITQALSNSFEWPLAMTAIILSFLVGLLVFIAVSIPLWQRIVFYLLNSLIIFSVAVGTSAGGSKGDTGALHSAKGALAEAGAQIKTLDAKINAVDETVKTLPSPEASVAQKQVNETKSAAKNVESTVAKANKDITRQVSKTFKSIHW